MWTNSKRANEDPTAFLFLAGSSERLTVPTTNSGSVSPQSRWEQEQRKLTRDVHDLQSANLEPAITEKLSFDSFKVIN